MDCSTFYGSHVYVSPMSESTFYGSHVYVSPMSESANVLLDHFECKTFEIIDVMTPENVKILSGKQNALRRNGPAVTSQKCECRTAGWKWRKSHRHNHYKIFKENHNAYSIVIKKAR